MKLITLSVAVVAFVFVTVSITDAQAEFKVGQRIEYKDKSYPKEVWMEGTVVKVLPEYHQVVVRWDPRDDYPSYTHNGVSIYEQAYNMDSVRPIAPKTENNPKENSDFKPVDAPKADNTGRRTAKGGAGTGLMSKQEIIDYMKTNGYANGQPKHDVQVCKDLIELMKKRGVKEAVPAGTEDSNVINANGCAGHWSTDVVEASVYNLGVPPTINWLAATWTLTKFGDTVYSAPGDGYIYKQGPKMGTQGALTINTNGNYAWNDGSRVIKGTWRNATSDEMKTRGGTGIVLQNAAEGIDWLVVKFQSTVPNKTERIDVGDLQHPGSHRWIGWRR